jgi:hypothetical protein
MLLNSAKTAVQPSTQLGSRAAGEAWRTLQASIVNGLFPLAASELLATPVQTFGVLVYANNYSAVTPPEIPGLPLSIICGRSELYSTQLLAFQAPSWCLTPLHGSLDYRKLSARMGSNLEEDPFAAKPESLGEAVCSLKVFCTLLG